MDELQRGFEIAGTGIGVVFAALVSLAVVTALLGKALMRGEAEPASDARTRPLPTPAQQAPPRTSDTDPAMVAAMVAAVQFVRRGLAPSTIAGGAAAVARDGGSVACAGTAGAHGLPGCACAASFGPAMTPIST